MTNAHTVPDVLAAARTAADQRRWSEAAELFLRADAEAPLGPADLDRLAEASWWTGELDRSIAARERSYSGHLAAGDRVRAAGAALGLANDHSHRLATSTATGWVRRAERLLEGEPESGEHGLLARAHLNAAIGRGDLDTALAEAERVLDLGARLGDANLEALGLQDRGRVLVAMGRTEEGLADLDEAIVAALSGELDPYPTAVVYCNATIACEDLTDYRRAGEWSDAARRWCERQSISGFPGMCRVRRAEIVRIRGDWVQAEAEARQACAELETFCLDYAGEGFYQIGEIRLRLGDHAGAEAAFRRSHELGRDPQPGLAMLRLATGNPAGAHELIQRALESPRATLLLRARMLPAAVEIALAADQRNAAAEAAEEMGTIATSLGTAAMRAAAAGSKGLVALASGDPGAAAEHFSEARRAWQEVEAPYEAARARMWLGEASLAAGRHEAAGLELHAALATFDALGAAPDAERARSLLSDPAAAQARLRGRRARRAFMFTDIVGSTQLIAAIGDEAWESLLAWHDQVIRQLSGERGGEEIHHAGDGFFLAFADAEAALSCAVAILRRFADHRRQNGFAPSVRVGIHVAEGIKRAASYEGAGVHAAARIGSLAGPDEILVSRETLGEAGGRFRGSAPRAVELRGLEGSVEVVSVEWR
ncbi:MAG TPA: adenylate/guanylate cyclase domain-containing protein [Candidatus Limnocylindria bacterium]|nr:adenylate/guanylate cyclase domain-containing protein [Candidatus Limnocylindria bacterium]